VLACGRAGVRACMCVRACGRTCGRMRAWVRVRGRGRVHVCLHVCLICAVHSGHLKETSEYWLSLKNLASPAAQLPVPSPPSEVAASWELSPPGTVVATGLIDLGGVAVDAAIAALVCRRGCTVPPNDTNGLKLLPAPSSATCAKGFEALFKAGVEVHGSLGKICRETPAAEKSGRRQQAASRAACGDVSDLCAPRRLTRIAVGPRSCDCHCRRMGFRYSSQSQEAGRRPRPCPHHRQMDSRDFSGSPMETGSPC
jgi:hypothetical protein